MRKLFLFVILTAVPMILSATNSVELENMLVHYRSLRLEEEMLQLIDVLEDVLEKTPQDGYILAMLCEALTEYEIWAKIPESEKVKFYEKAVVTGKKAAEMLPSSSYANFVAGAAIGRLAQFKGIIQSLFMLGDFDKYIQKAIELDPKNYRALIAMGMRYRDTPWPFRDLKKSEEYFLKAIEAEPGYINSYYELALLYEEMAKASRSKEEKDNYLTKAKELYERILEMEPHPQWIKQGLETKEIVAKKIGK